MPKTTKDVTKKTAKKETTNSKNSTKKTTKKSNSVTKSKSVATKKTATKKDTSVTTKKKATTTKRTSSSAKKKTSSVKKSTNKKVDFVEYYDLPYRYNQTTVKVLAQTPQMLFVYWDISDEDRLAFTTKFGDDFFNKTKPVLLVHNETMNYTFEVEINDFANSWYLHVNDANCKYVIELGRRPNLYQDTVKESYIYVTSSNEMDAPNDHILFEKFNPNVSYRNVKTGELSKKDFSHLSKFKNMQEIYGIYDLYKKIYKNELFDEIVDGNLSNSSSLSSSQFK
ncbi:MAG: DUF4912 domain-containing protein [Clostridia bacterium]|nr:DUF4912 domain-containing protein [Clostridia bacterium]